MSDSESDESQGQGPSTQFIGVPFPGANGMVMTPLPPREVVPPHPQNAIVYQQDFVLQPNAATRRSGMHETNLVLLTRTTFAPNNTVATQGAVFQGRDMNEVSLAFSAIINPVGGAPPVTTATTQGPELQSRTTTEAASRVFETHHTVNPNIGPPPATAANPPPVTTGGHQPAVFVPPRSQKPVTTLVNVLPKTPYDETKEPDGTERTLEYVKVQRRILEYLGRKAAEMLTGAEACHWTNAISFEPNPKAEEALRLCYYMRSQGFDTYTRLKDDYMMLYVAHPNRIHVGEPNTKTHHVMDTLYWKQDTLTDEVVFRLSPQTSSSSRLRGRRNALVPLQPMDGAIQGLHTRSSNAPRSRNGGHNTNVQQQGAQPNAGAALRSTPSNLAALIASTKATIRSLLLDADFDEAEIQALVTQLEEYQTLRD